jgi:hypothetical protein
MATYQTAQLVAQKQQEKQEQQHDKKRLYTLGRCNYTSAGKMVAAEAFTEIVDPHPQDLKELQEHGIVLELTEAQVGAAKTLRALPIADLARLKQVLSL